VERQRGLEDQIEHIGGVKKLNVMEVKWIANSIGDDGMFNEESPNFDKHCTIYPCFR